MCWGSSRMSQKAESEERGWPPWIGSEWNTAGRNMVDLRHSFFEAVCYLKQSTPKKPVLVDQFGLFSDEQQILRCKGRINNSSLPMETKQPILLPKESEFVQLLIQHVHLRNLHSSVRDTLVCLWEKYWVIKGRQVIRTVIKSCVQCRRYEGQSFSTAMPPDLPTVRVSEDPPFTHVLHNGYLVCENSMHNGEEARRSLSCFDALKKS